MRVEVSPSRVTAAPGRPVVVTVRVANDGTLISGHRIRILGIDESWARIDQPELSLFPDASATAVLTVTLPRGIPAGTRRVDIEVRELTPPAAVTVATVELAVPEQTDLKVSLDPTSASGGNGTAVGVLIENAGNAVVDLPLAGSDAEGVISFTFAPQVASLAPGEQVLASAKLRAPRPLLGSPKIRPYSIEAGPPSAPVVAQGAWVQRPRLSRGALALTGLLAALTVFAVVIAVALSSVVSQSNANRDLALQVAAASANRSGASGTSSLSGTVSELATGATASGITVDLFEAANPGSPIVSTSTGTAGTFDFKGLVAGQYKVRFDGAGFAELWYPQSLDAAGAKTVTVGNGANVAGVNVYLGGLPATISGQVDGTGVGGALLTLELPDGSPTAAPVTAAAQRGPRGGGTVLAAVTRPITAAMPAPTIVKTQTLGSSGQFSFAGVPSPAVYDLVLTKAGYATTTQQIDLGGGEARTGLTLQLTEGDGSVSGVITSSSGRRLGAATVSATSGTSTITTISETTPGHLGDFSLTNLPTPASLTVVVAAAGFASQTIAVSLSANQQVSGVHVVLSPGVGAISGIVHTPAGSPTGGVMVVATNGKVSLTTETLSVGRVGSYSFTGLSVPSTYTLTFSRPDLASQSLAVSLPDAGSTTVRGFDVTMATATATLEGVVTQLCPTPNLPPQSGGKGCVNDSGAPNVTVALESGSVSYTVSTASQAAGGHPAGFYEIAGITPGTYTLSFTRPGGVPQSKVIQLRAGPPQTASLELPPAASIFGYVVLAGTSTPATGSVVTLYLSDEYPTVPLESETLTAADNGQFQFDNLQAPDSYIVAVAGSSGAAVQETVQVTTASGVTSPVCGDEATGRSTTSATTTTTTASTSTTVTTTAGSGGGACTVASAPSDPIQVTNS